jgi:hypothetical protein
MPADYPSPGSGSLHWNAGGWFGSQLGGTAWLLVGAAVLAWQAPAVAVVWLAAFVVTNALGVWLWRRRARFRPYSALQLLLLTCGGSGLLACFLLDRLRPDVAERMGWTPSGYRMFVIVPALMAWFAIREYGPRWRVRSLGHAGPGAADERPSN